LDFQSVLSFGLVSKKTGVIVGEWIVNKHFKNIQSDELIVLMDLIRASYTGTHPKSRRGKYSCVSVFVNQFKLKDYYIGSHYQFSRRSINFCSSYLLSSGERKVNSHKDYLLILSLYWGFTDLTKFLIRNCEADATCFKNLPIIIATHWGKLDVVELLLENNAVDISINNNLPIRLACSKGHIDLLNFYLSNDIKNRQADLPEILKFSHKKRFYINPFARGCRGFLLACKLGHLPIVRRLIEEGLDPSVYKNKGIKVASKYGQHEMIRLLLEYKEVDPTCRKDYPLRISVRYGHFESVKILLSQLEVNPSSVWNESYYLARGKHRNIQELLMKNPRIDFTISPPVGKMREKMPYFSQQRYYIVTSARIRT